MDQYWVFGDNILECERALRLIAESAPAPHGEITWLPSPLYAPRYEVKKEDQQLFSVQLFPGYGRWGYDVQDRLRQLGAPLREASDAVVLRLTEDTGDSVDLAMAFEFCGALPAGNNAWQRCGRALACAYAGVPYLYFAELGGVELDANRNIKAARLPNPLVPFAYLSLGQTTGSLVVPVFTPSPSISERVAKPFLQCMGKDEARVVVRELLSKATGKSDALKKLQEKAIRATQVLASLRKRKDTTLQGEEWVDFSKQTSGAEKAAWLLNKGMPWNKKVAIEDLTKTFRELLVAAKTAGAVAPGSQDMPFCLLSPESRTKFARSIENLYGKRVSNDFIEWVAKQPFPLVVVWVCGFKPRGDDSRPDRGLVPLARMLLGLKDVQCLSVVYGPATQTTWQRLVADMWGLAKINGLWEAVVGLSNAILIDSATSGTLKTIGYIVTKAPPGPITPKVSRKVVNMPIFGEHDVDSVLHALFSTTRGSEVFEAICNPPGGDWSGLSLQPLPGGEILRWTSLPRVSGKDTKRPDHVIVFYRTPISILSIESKDVAATVEIGIGPRLSSYVRELLKGAPNIWREATAQVWKPYDRKFSPAQAEMLSGAAFRYATKQEMQVVLNRASVDIVLALEFLPDKELTRLHVMSKLVAAWVGQKLCELALHFPGRLEIQIH